MLTHAGRRVLLRGSASCARAQALFEYALLISAIAVAVLALRPLGQRGVQAMIKKAADGLSPARYIVGSTIPNTPIPDPHGEWAQIEGMRFDSGETRTRAIVPGTIRAKAQATRERVWQLNTSEETLGGGYTTSGWDVTRVTGALRDQDCPRPGPGPSVSDASSCFDVVTYVHTRPQTPAEIGNRPP